MVRMKPKYIEKPKDIKEYRRWLEENHGIEVDIKLQKYYDSVTLQMKQDFETSEVWKKINDNLNNLSTVYEIETSYPLMMPPFRSEIYIKEFDSFLLKTYRKNILLNKNWPDSPKGGWILPDNWFSRINDIIRTLIVVKYLDGAEFIIKKIRNIANECEVKSHYFMESREEGYYAAHIYLCKQFEIPEINWDTKIIESKIEIQITTQLQEVIRKLLHKYYEERRVMSNSNKKLIPWQWDYESKEFSTNYLGHILHYIEGMIMEIRRKQEEE